MRHLHPNLGARAWGLRKKAYVAALLAAAVGGASCALLVGFGAIAPTPIDVYLSWVMLFILFVPFMAFYDNPGEQRTRVEKWSEFGFCWLLVSGIAQTFWELPWFFLDFFGVVHGATAEDKWLWVWWVYGGADTRYLTSSPTIAGLEFMAGFSGPFELYAWWLYTHSRTIRQKLTASWMALIIGVGLTYQTGVFFIAEWHIGWASIQQGATGFWLKFVGLNVPWIIAPVIALPAAIYEIAHWYRVEGYEAAKRELLTEQSAQPPALARAS
jgi:hypothetical protein